MYLQGNVPIRHLVKNFFLCLDKDLSPKAMNVHNKMPIIFSAENYKDGRQKEGSVGITRNHVSGSPRGF